MHKISPRLGFYIISLGTVIQFLGLSGDSWASGSSSSSNGALSFSHPGDVMLVIGMALTVLGVIVGFISLAETLPNERDRSPRLLPALPLVLLVGLSIGSVAFAFQAGDNPSNAAVAASEVNGSTEPSKTPFVIGTPGPNDCIEGTIWHPVMGHCMTPAAIAALESTECPPGFILHPDLLACFPVSVSADGGITITTPAPGTTPVCPNGFFWHPVMDHCMETAEVVCPAGYQWSTALLSCTTTSSGGTVSTPPPNVTPVCPIDSFWHPVMNHCMSTVCPPGFQFDFTYETCLQVGPVPTTTPTATPTPPVTPTPPPGESCPEGYFWNPAKGHCDSTSCPEGLVFDFDILYCVLPETPTPTSTPPPSCPDGYFWHPAMGHCMNNECPPGLEFDPVTLFCVLPGSTETPEPTPTSTPPPSCPDGYFWHPAMGHCMNNECPPGLEFDPVTLFCVLPGETSEPTETPTVTPTPTPLYDLCPEGYFWNPAKGHCDSRECPPGLVFDMELLYCVFPATPEPTPVPTDAPTPEPSCPAGYFWHPAMGHCMNEECPPGLVFDRDTLYCVLPP